jgi:Enoyl-(Acyl carrier protein) reductase
VDIESTNVKEIEEMQESMFALEVDADKETLRPVLALSRGHHPMFGESRIWTNDLKDRRIRSNVVSPGPIRTPLTGRQSAELIARIVSTIPMGRMGEPDEVAKAALYLASDDSSFVSGIELFVDGGRAQV